MNKLKFQAEKHGIKYQRQFEWYTSKASFLDNDEIPQWISGKKHVFSGKRKSRGVYQSKDGRILNADVNAAANILRQCKLISEDDIHTLQLKGFVQPKRINPLKLNRT
jgi:putative transposase